MADLVEEMPVGKMSMSGEELNISTIEEDELIRDDDMSMQEGEYESPMPENDFEASEADEMEPFPSMTMDTSALSNSIDLPGTWRLSLTRVSQ